MKKTIIEFINYETKERSDRLLYGNVSVVIGANEIRIIRHDEGQKVDVVNTTGLQLVIRNWG